jgi:hypothetical protein
MSGASYAEMGRCLLIPKYEFVLPRKERGERVAGETGWEAGGRAKLGKLRNVRNFGDDFFDAGSRRVGRVPYDPIV